MPNPIYQKRLLTRIEAAIREAEDAGLLAHRGLEGKAREVFVRGLLAPLMPPNVELGNGKIIDSQGGISAETDVVIHSRATMPPLVYDAGFAAYPVEACPYVVEVKTSLSTREVRDTVEKLRRLQELKTLPSFVDIFSYRAVAAPCPAPTTGLFAFGSDLSGVRETELDRYRRHDPNADTRPVLQAICVVGRGYWFFHNDGSEKKWVFSQPTPDHLEVLEFLAGVANTIPDAIAIRGRPRIGNYLIGGRKFERQ